MLGDIIKDFIEIEKKRDCLEKIDTQDKFAEKIGVTDRMLRYYISGLHIPPTVILKRIAVLTKTSMDELAKDVK